MNNLPTDNNEITAIKKLFNGAFYQNVPVSQGTYDVIYGFFMDRTGLKESADALTQSLLTIASTNRVQPLDILKEFDKAATISDFKKVLIAMFNAGRTPTSKLGYTRGSLTIKWTARNINP